MSNLTINNPANPYNASQSSDANTTGDASAQWTAVVAAQKDASNGSEPGQLAATKNGSQPNQAGATINGAQPSEAANRDPTDDSSFDIVGKFQGHVRGDDANAAIIKKLIDDYRP